MTNFPIVDLVIGLIFIYFLLGVITSSAVEIILNLSRARAKVLEAWLLKIFDTNSLKPDGTVTDKTLGQAIVDHCLLTAMSKNKQATSYMKAETFVSALLDHITRIKVTAEEVQKEITTLPELQWPPLNLEGYKTAIEKSPVISMELKRTFLSFLNEAAATYAAIIKNTSSAIPNLKSDIDLFREKLENWYDTNGDRLTGAMKKKYSVPWTAVIGLIITISINADSISLATYLYNNKDARESLSKTALAKAGDTVWVNKVKVLAAQTNDSVTAKDLQKHVEDVQNAYAIVNSSVPLSWNNVCLHDFKDVVSKIMGLLATFLAIMLGAPFWFDLLGKISNLRSTGPKPSTSAADDKKQGT